MNMTPWDRLNNELNRRKLGWQWVANGLNFDIQRVHNWKSRGIPAMHLRALADLFGETVDWIEGLAEHKVQEPIAMYNTNPIIQKGKVPLINWVQAGNWCDGAEHAPGDVEWIDCPAKHSKLTYALAVRGSSMYNPQGPRSFDDGDIIFIDPERTPQNRSLVVCRLGGSNQATFKQLLVEGEERYLQALNNDWPEKIIKITELTIICGVVIGKFESY